MKIDLHHNNGGYSIIAAIMLVGFLLVLCSGILKAVLLEMQDNKWRQEYLKASAWALWALELSLLEIKEYGYGFDGYQEDISTLWETRKTALMHYDFESRVKEYKGELEPYETTFIPLFWIDEWGIYSLSWDDISLSVNDEVAWNIIGNNTGMSGRWPFSSLSQTYVTWIDGTKSFISVKDFLASNSQSYLQLYNTNSVSQEEVTLKIDTISNEYFTLPSASIFAKWTIGNHHQNLIAEVDNTNFLQILRYSIFSQ